MAVEQQSEPTSNEPLQRLKPHFTVTPVQRSLNGGIFDLKDPANEAGIDIDAFGTALLYQVERQHQPKVIAELYERVTQAVLEGKIPGARVQLVDFSDTSTGQSEIPRRYVIIERETNRGTRMSLYATFQSYGDGIYVRAQAFVFGPLSMAALVLAVVLSVGASALLLPTGVGICLIPGVLYFFFGPTLKLILTGNAPALALRKSFNRGLDLGTFNLDDILIFFKYVTPQILDSVRDVLQENDIPQRLLDPIDQRIQNINNVTNISNSGGIMSMVGNILGGSNNKSLISSR